MLDSHISVVPIRVWNHVSGLNFQFVLCSLVFLIWVLRRIIFSSFEFFVFNIIIQKLIELIYFKIRSDFSKFIYFNIKSFQLIMNLRISFFRFFLRYAELLRLARRWMFDPIKLLFKQEVYWIL